MNNNRLIEAIVFESNAGHTEKYAQLLAQETKLPCMSLSDAIKILPEGIPVIFMGWLMAGQVAGYKKAEKRFSVKVICTVGMSRTDLQTPDVRKKYKLTCDFPIFYLQGGFELDKLSGVYRVMMSTMKNTAAKSLEKKENKSDEEKEMLDIMTNGADLVDKEKLTDIINWLKE